MLLESRPLHDYCIFHTDTFANAYARTDSHVRPYFRGWIDRRGGINICRRNHTRRSFGEELGGGTVNTREVERGGCDGGTGVSAAHSLDSRGGLHLSPEILRLIHVHLPGRGQRRDDVLLEPKYLVGFDEWILTLGQLYRRAHSRCTGRLLIHGHLDLVKE